MSKTLPACLLLASTLLCVYPLRAQSVGTAASRERISSDEREALVALYQATDGGHWKNHDRWLGPEGTECDWYGIRCDFYAHAPQVSSPWVAGIELDENNLKGPIPEALGQLSYLESLSIVGNYLSGRIPDKLIERMRSGGLDIWAEPYLLTDVSEIDFEWNPSALLCATKRIIFNSDGKATLFTTRCRNATPRDRVTFCEVKKGFVGESFARLAWLLEKNGFFDLQPNYSRSITDSVSISTRVKRAGNTYEVVDYAGGGPFELWTIENAIQGQAFSILWTKTSRTAKCPRWDDSKSP